MLSFGVWAWNMAQWIPHSLIEISGYVRHNLISPVYNWSLEKDIPDLSGQVAIVTGGNSGLGRASVEALAKRGATVYMASRSRDKAMEAIDAIKSVHPQAKVHFLQLDLTSLASVKKAAEEFLSKETLLHILLNNAAVMAIPFGLTNDGLEIQWQTNYVSHFLFTKLLLPTLLHTAENSPVGRVRIVNVSSQACQGAWGIDYEDTSCKNYYIGRWGRYNQSKLANVLHAKALAKLYGDKNILCFSLHPGFVYTNLQKPVSDESRIVKLFMGGLRPYNLRPEVGAVTQLWTATSPELTLKDNGKYYVPFMKEALPPVPARDDKEVDELWRYTEKLLEEKSY